MNTTAQLTKQQTTQRTTVEPTPIRENAFGNQYGNKTAPSGNKPIAKFKAGAVVSTIWANTAQGPTGDVQYFSVSIDRRYMDKAGAWQSTSSLRVNDLPKAALVLQKAFEFLVMKDNGEQAAGQPAYAGYAGHAAAGSQAGAGILNPIEEEVLVV